MAPKRPRIVSVKLHLGDFHSGTFHLDAVELGAYVRLFLWHYDLGFNGIPNDDIKILARARVRPRSWARVRKTVMAMFTYQAKTNTYTHPRVQAELRMVTSMATLNHAKALKGHATRSAASVIHDIASNLGGGKKKKEEENPLPLSQDNPPPPTTADGSTLVDFFKAARLTELPPDWLAFGRALMKQAGKDPNDVRRQAETFVHWFTVGKGHHIRQKDWNARFNKWLREAR